MRMMNPNASIVIVDDAKFSSAVIQKTLELNGYQDVRVANNAIDGLSMIKERNADVLLADWLMPGMDGLALTQLVRELNKRKNTFTYVILLTAKEELSHFQEAFSKGVDDFVGKTDLKTHLPPRVRAAYRIARLQNDLLNRELKLKNEFRKLTLASQMDLATGLGNIDFLEQQLSRYIRHQQSRDGHIGLLLCRMDNLKKIEDQFGKTSINELLKQASCRLREAARPLDDIARINNDTLALCIYGNDPNFVTHNLVRRVQDSLLTKAYESPDGFISLIGTMQYEVLEKSAAQDLDATVFLQSALQRLNELSEGQSMHIWETLNELS